MSYDQRRAEALGLLKKHAAQLAEHFDTVQIFVTHQEGEITTSAIEGAGNWFARYGQVRQWVEYEHKHVNLDEPDGDDEDDGDG
jgi:hypothetical protein